MQCSPVLPMGTTLEEVECGQLGGRGGGGEKHLGEGRVRRCAESLL